MTQIPAETSAAARAGAALSSIGKLSFQEALRDLASGAVGAVIAVAYCISFGAMIFSEHLVSSLSVGLNLILLGAAVTGILIALGTSLPRATGGPDTSAVAVFAALATSVLAGLPAGASGEQATLAVLTAICLTSVLTGVLLFALGVMRIGGVVRFVPYSVVAGFLAASGCLLINGAYRVATKTPLTLANIGETISTPSFASSNLLCTVVFAACVFFIRQRVRHFVVLPICVVAGIAVMHVLIAAGIVGGGATADARWFLQMPSQAELMVPLMDPGQFDALMRMFFANFGEIAAVALVTAMAIILNTSCIEAIWNTTSDLNWELRLTGVANIVSGAVGGMAGNVSLNRSLLNRESGGVGRLSALVPALACGALLLMNRDLLTYMPSSILAGLLMFLGVSIVRNSVGWASLRRDWPELLLIAVITGTILFVGYFEGLIAGVIGACLLFAYTYSRVDIIKHEFTRSDRNSNVERSLEDARYLSENGERVRIFVLQGYLFFGSSSRIVKHISRWFEETKGTRPEIVIVSFRLVSGIDISTVLNLVKLRNACMEHGSRLVLCGLSEQVADMVHESNQNLIDGDHVQQFETLHDALEWAEDELLRTRAADRDEHDRFETWLRCQVGDKPVDGGILEYLEKLEFKAGDRLVAQTEPSDAIDLVVSGRVSVLLERPDGPPIRLRTMLGHTVLGEMGFYRNTPRTASVVAEEDTVIYRLSRDAFDRLSQEEPRTAAEFHKFIVCVLADRLSFANTEIAALEQ